MNMFKRIRVLLQLVSKESYCVVFDTIIENLPQDIQIDLGILK